MKLTLFLMPILWLSLSDCVQSSYSEDDVVELPNAAVMPRLRFGKRFEESNVKLPRLRFGKRDLMLPRLRFGKRVEIGAIALEDDDLNSGNKPRTFWERDGRADIESPRPRLRFG